jgi:hypothetical protein
MEQEKRAKAGEGSPAILARLDLRCGGPVRVVDLAADLRGDVTDRLVPYSREINRKLLEASVRATPFLTILPTAELDRLARLPEATTCRREMRSTSCRMWLETSTKRPAAASSWKRPMISARSVRSRVPRSAIR